MTVRNLGGRSTAGLSIASGVLGGVSQAATGLGSFFEKKEERERRKPFEDLRLREQTARTKGAESTLAADQAQSEATAETKRQIAEIYKTKFGFSDEDAEFEADFADKSDAKNTMIIDAIDDEDLIEKTKTPEGSRAVLEEIGALEDSSRGEQIRNSMPEDAKAIIAEIMAGASKEVEVPEIPTPDEIAADGVLKPGQQAAEAPTTSVFRPNTAGELSKVEPEQEPEEVQTARKLKVIFDQAADNPAFKNQAANNQKIIDDFESGKASIAAGEEKERIRLEEKGDKTEAAKLLADAKVEESRLKREFDREDTAIKNQYLKDLAEAKAKDPSQKKVSVPIVTGITETGAALVRFKQLRKLLKENKVGVFERGLPLIGGFTNPEVESAMSYLKNRLGRKDSGAAISAGEWKVFEKLILDTKNLTSEKGRIVALAKIDQHIEDFGIFGTELSKGDEDWFEKYQKTASNARKNIVGDDDIKKETVETETSFSKEDETRLEELERKALEGTIQ